MRKVSFKILFDIFFNNVLLNVAIDNYFNNEKLKDADKAFIKRETTGVIEKIDEIDKCIDKHSKVKIKKLNKDILVVLRLGIYEIKYMDKVPHFATINECVNIIKKSKSSKLSGYVNAILRNVVREKEKSVSEHDFNDINVNKSIEKNCYFKVYNDAKEDVIKELNDKSIKYDSYEGLLDFNYGGVYKVNKYKDIIDTDNFRLGNILIEDASSIYMVDKLVSYIDELQLKKIDILDTCSSPGGKILSLIDTLSNNTKIESIDAIACDISSEKIKKIKENAYRLKIKNVKKISLNIEVKDATVFDDNYNERFDVVMCDVPCTGLGVVAKKPDIKLNYTDEKKVSLVKIQRQILDISKMYVKEGGMLIYSTCTTTKEENSDNINYFLEMNKYFTKIYEKQIELNDGNNADGFYMCFMKKND